MSMDLFFRPKDAPTGIEPWKIYLASRSHVSVEGNVATYLNKDTGVYFQCHISDGAQATDPAGYPISLHVNFVRPRYWIWEIAPFISDFVSTFAFDILDPQVGGKGEGPYDVNRMINGWETGNKFACSVMRARGTAILTMPGSRLDAIWRWNMGRHQRQAELKIDRFIPQIMFAAASDRKVVTVAVWGDAIPSILPPVDYLLIPRHELASRIFGVLPRKDKTILDWEQAVQLLAQHAEREDGGALMMRDDRRPREVTRAIRALPSTEWDFTLINSDMVLDSELLSEP